MNTLWGRATSSNVMKVLWLADELAIPYTLREVGGPYGGTDTPEYRAMNPTGLVPTWQESNWSLWESNAILRHLAATHAAGTPFCPPDARRRAEIDRWMDAQQTLLTPPQNIVFIGLVRTAPDARDMKAIGAAVARADAVWRILDAQIARSGAYVAGTALSLADICWGVHVHRWFNLDVERSEVPALRRWYDRLLALPAYARHCARPLV